MANVKKKRDDCCNKHSFELFCFTVMLTTEQVMLDKQYFRLMSRISLLGRDVLKWQKDRDMSCRLLTVHCVMHVHSNPLRIRCSRVLSSSSSSS